MIQNKKLFPLFAATAFLILAISIICVNAINPSRNNFICPWVMFNLINYHAFTGMKEHVAFVIQIVNPGRIPIDIVDGLSKIFTFFITAQESYLPHDSIEEFLVYFFNVCMWCILIVSGSNFFSVSKIKELIFNYAKEEKRTILSQFYLLAVIGNITILICGTVSSRCVILIGRYLSLTCIPVLFIIINLFENTKDENHQYISNAFLKVIGCILAFTVCFLCEEDILHRSGEKVLNKTINYMHVKGSLPDYPHSEKNSPFTVDDETYNNGVLYLRGWAYHENDNCTVYIKNDGKFYKATVQSRPDVKAAFSLADDKQGFAISLNTENKDYALYLVNETKQEIYTLKKKES